MSKRKIKITKEEEEEINKKVKKLSDLSKSTIEINKESIEIIKETNKIVKNVGKIVEEMNEKKEESSSEDEESEDYESEIIDKKRKLNKNIKYALLIKPGTENIEEVEIRRKNSLEDMQKYIGGRVERAFQLLKKVYYDKDHIYQYELWIDEEGGPFCKDLNYNGCATISLHPNAEYSNGGSHRLHGPVLMIRTGKQKNKGLFLEDWKRISRATYYNEELVEKNIDENEK